MSTPAHILSGAYLGVIAAQVAPTETAYIAAAAISAGILDIDHIFYLVRDWKFYRAKGFVGTLHNARSFFHELAGLTILGIVMLAISFFNIKLALVIGVPFTLHIAVDMILGKSAPLMPFDKTQIQVTNLSMKAKTIIDVITIITFSLLWIRYLNVV